MIQKSKTPICDKNKFHSKRKIVIPFDVAQKLERSLIKARKQLKVFKDSEKRQRKWDEVERIEENNRRDNLAREAFYTGWT